MVEINIVGFHLIQFTSGNHTLWADAIVFAVLVAVLVVKPTGLLGKPMQEKV